LGPVMGRLASQLLGQGVEAAAARLQHSPAQVEEAVTLAFAKVQGQFHWDGARQRWVGGAAGGATGAAGPGAAGAPSSAAALAGAGAASAGAAALAGAAAIGGTAAGAPSPLA